MNAEIHVGDVGTRLEFPFTDEDGEVFDLSGATSRQVVLRKPEGTSVTKELALATDGTDGIGVYVTVEGDLDQAGEWRAQGIVTGGAGTWRSNVVRLLVHRNLA